VRVVHIHTAGGASLMDYSASITPPADSGLWRLTAGGSSPRRLLPGARALGGGLSPTRQQQRQGRPTSAHPALRGELAG
jgi:hypothetical protein